MSEEKKNEGTELIENLEERVRAEKRRSRIRIISAIVLFAAVFVGGYFFITYQTYSKTGLIASYKIEDVEKYNYKEFAGGFLKYSRDGVSFIDKKGKERWNQAYQMKNPMISVCDQTAVISDKGGNDMIVLRKTGMKGEIHTTLPISKTVVSAQGITGAVLKNDSVSEIVCYDSAGNVLVEHQASLSNLGEPVDLALSPNGYLLAVSYLSMQEGSLVSKVAYYNFNETGKNTKSNKVTEDEYKNEVMPSVFFMDNRVSAVISDASLVLYEGKEIPKKTSVVKLDKEIKSAFHDEKYIGFVLKNKGSAGYEICLYDKKGKKVMSESFEGEYSDIKLSKGQIIMYNGTVCNVFTRNGIHKFEGEFQTNILDIFPLAGINKYLVINANGMEEVRLLK